ncbi:hypothetical protein CDD83_7897 [Cordyceps sp. RAO-2017]|nr:hypothetical protein CDD83_7897 [Cordyceps sp. RAO-2017]
MAAAASSTFGSPLSITFVGTATAVLDIDGTAILTDPCFSPAGRVLDVGAFTLRVTRGPALQPDRLPPVDAVLLSHEDHPDNLDDLGRRLLDGRRVFTTRDGARNLGPRPGLLGMRPWETGTLAVGGRRYDITATPCVHVPGGECVGFVVGSSAFGQTGGLPNAIWFSGDTVYFDELRQIGSRFHVSVAIMNLGAAAVPGGPPITMGGRDAARLFKEIGADILVPMHFDSWAHFAEDRAALARAFDESGVLESVCWLDPGKPKKVI